MRCHRSYLLGTAIAAAVIAGTAWALPSTDPAFAAAASTAEDFGIPEGQDATILDVARLTAPEPVAAPADVDPLDRPPGAKVLVLASRGRGPNVSQEPGRVQFEVPLYDLVTGEQVGNSKHNFICDGFMSCEDIDTYILPEGTLTKKARVSFNVDGERPGWVLVGAAPDVAPLDGTGIFGGKEGSVRVAGWANTSELPDYMSLNEIYVITVHP